MLKRKPFFSLIYYFFNQSIKNHINFQFFLKTLTRAKKNKEEEKLHFPMILFEYEEEERKLVNPGVELKGILTENIVIVK